VPLTHPPGEVQADIGEVVVMIAGVECEAHYLATNPPHSDDFISESSVRVVQH